MLNRAQYHFHMHFHISSKKYQKSLHISIPNPVFPSTATLEPSIIKSQTAQTFRCYPSTFYHQVTDWKHHSNLKRHAMMENTQDYLLYQYCSDAREASNMSMLLPKPPPNLSLTGTLAQRRQQNISGRMAKRSQLSPPQSPNIAHNLAAPLPQNIPHATQISPSASPTSTPSTSPGQLAYHQSQTFYNQMHLQLNNLKVELITELQNREHCRNNPSRSQRREISASLFEKRQEIAWLQERVASMAQGIQDINKNESQDGMWDAASLGEVTEEEAIAEAEEWVRSTSRLTNEEVNEAIAEAWREAYPERELGW